MRGRVKVDTKSKATNRVKRIALLLTRNEQKKNDERENYSEVSELCDNEYGTFIHHTRINVYRLAIKTYRSEYM